MLALLRRLQAERGLAYLFITHDLAVVRAMATRIAVMRDGRILEVGPAEAILAAPQEAYTRGLIEAAFGEGQMREDFVPNDLGGPEPEQGRSP